ncbi:TniQ family protein [Cellvibrio sp. NN19]|uniref:TniQ family protein n=1 Tax=Cellvibrio chitinivorans TaxID=3102792 RepID=UPI002B416ADC|nr:TniQ family protein [Cellvibrio sp. NN19]
MLSGNYWPAHPHPLEDELFSCWIVRLIHANGLKLQTFCDRELNKNWQLWNRDIDRIAPEWLVNTLSQKTGATLQEVMNSTLLSYQGILFNNVRRCGELKWVMPLGIYHRTRKNFGLQFCPLCLREDQSPYFRKTWRLALFTYCLKHQCMLHEKCPACGSAVIFQRTELGKPKVIDRVELDKCWKCNFCYGDAKINKIEISIQNKLNNELQTLSHTESIEFFNILHHFCKMICSVSLARKLENFICKEGNIEKLDLSEGRISFERRSLYERHYILTLCNWLIDDWREKVPFAIIKKAVRYNHLIKDFQDAPLHYSDALKKFNRKIKSN